MPAVGDVVYARVTRISKSRGAECQIFATLKPLSREFRGTVRTVDFASPALQEFSQVSDCFRPGDIIRAKIISLGDSKSFFLSTVPDDCGVVFAGNLNPASYKLVALDGQVERRKVAKPVWLESKT